jgi:thiol-disulfide isomerase/thioredoxin
MQRIVNRTLGLGCGLAFLLGGLTGCGSTLKDYTFTDARGAERSLSDFQGQVVVMGFSNTWCDPCQDAALTMQGIQEKYGGLGVKVLSVSSWEQGDPQRYLAENGYTYGLLINGTDLAREYKVDRLPTFVVVGVNGDIIYRHEGLRGSTAQRIDRVLDKHLRRHGAYAQHNG